MGKETKIGLLVGMCFIICFAVILSHRSEKTQGDIPIQSFEISKVVRNAESVVDDALPPKRVPRIRVRHRNEPTTASAPRQENLDRAVQPGNPNQNDVADRLAQATSPTETPNRVNPMRYGPVESNRQDTLAVPLPSADPGAVFADILDRFSSRGEAIEGDHPSSNPMPQAGLRRRETVSDDQNRKPIRINNPLPTVKEEAERQFKPQSDIHETPVYASADQKQPVTLEARMPQENFEKPVYRADNRIQKTAGSILATHKVQAGDTLGRIANRYYNSSRQDYVKAIFEANRDSLSSPDTVYAGRELVIPVLNDVAEQPAVNAIQDKKREMVSSDINELVNGGVEKNTAVAAGATYTVKSGDMLSRIAARHYGSSAKRIVDAIYAANKDVMSSPNNLVAGRTIRLPVLAEKKVEKNEVSPVQDKPARVDTPETSKPEKGQDRGREGVDWDWYQLKKGDVYSTVAANLLGTSRKWSELARLNDDIFPDASRIRHGVQIRIPRVNGKRVWDNSGREGA